MHVSQDGSLATIQLLGRITFSSLLREKPSLSPTLPILPYLPHPTHLPTRLPSRLPTNQPSNLPYHLFSHQLAHLFTSPPPFLQLFHLLPTPWMYLHHLPAAHSQRQGLLAEHLTNLLALQLEQSRTSTVFWIALIVQLMSPTWRGQLEWRGIW